MRFDFKTQTFRRF